jgi:hypothetical protein
MVSLSQVGMREPGGTPKMGNGIPFPGAFLKKSPWGSYNSNILANKYPVNDIVFWIKNQIIGDCRCLLEKKKRAARKIGPLSICQNEL